MLPRDSAMQCTLATSAWLKEMPPNMLPISMLLRAVRSFPFSTAFTRFWLISSIAYSAAASPMGSAQVAVKPSMACVRASTPVAAVTEAGTVRVSSGSHTAMFAAVYGLFTVIL